MSIFGDQRITHFSPDGSTSDRQSGRVFNRQILERMDRTMDRAGEQLTLQLLGKDTLASNFRQRLVEDLVALGGDDLLLALQIEINIFQGVDHPLGLPAGESGGTGCKNKFHG